MTDPCTEVRADCNTRFDALEAWQGRQNGSLQRIEGKVDKLLYAIVTAGATLIGTLVVLSIQLARG